MEDRTEYLNVPVPSYLLMDVYRFIASQEAGSEAGEAEPAQVPPEEREQKEWTEDLIARMYRESPGQSVQPFLLKLASRAGEWVPTSTLTDAISKAREKPITRNSIAGMLGAFGRRVKNRYGMETWPIDKEYDHTAEENLYRMSENVAEVIRKVSD